MSKEELRIRFNTFWDADPEKKESFPTPDVTSVRIGLIEYPQAAELPMVFAINKIDTPSANPDKNLLKHMKFTL